jgi:SNF2 family DNA or RNA helicase/plasmid stabilization system protein ParE
MALEPGTLVRVRSRQYLVEEVTPAPTLIEQTLVRLSCIDDDSQGAPLEVLWEKEVDRQIIETSSWKDIAKRGFDPPRQFSAYLHTLRWNLVTSTNPRLFQAPYRAGIQVKAYQLEPLRKALQLPRANLFIADDVGLGKTIEAGLILRELIMRQKVRTVVVACPPSVILQWKDELENRFGLNFVVFDRDYVLGKRRERGYGVNPWATHSRFIISHALLRDEAYSGPLRDWLGEFSPSSLLILDEAHNAAPASGARYAIDSAFTRIVRDIAWRFEHRLFLSATPHNGHSNSFAALLEILDPQRFCRGVPLKNPKVLDEVMVRRLKDDLREIGEDFPLRKVIQVDIDGLPAESAELKLSNLLSDYRNARDSRLKDAARSIQIASGLVTTSLQKRLLSSIEAFALTLGVHRKAFDKRLAESKASADHVPSEQDLLLLASPPGSDDERAEVSEDEVSAEEQGQIETATLHTITGQGKAAESRQLLTEKALLDEMEQIADQARGLADARIRWFVQWIRRNMCPGLPELGKRSAGGTVAKWNERRVIIFTEYADTKRYLLQQLSAAIADTERAETRIGTFHGGMDDESREEVKRAFNTDPKKHPLRILIATDAAREGINLQNHCADLFHFDVPWNPSRMEQRNGRIDRKLQRAPEVRCYYFVYKQRPEDRVLQVLVKKTETIQRELGSLSPVIEKRLKFGIRRDEIDSITKEIEAEDLPKDFKASVDEELEAIRQRRNELSGQLTQLQDILAKSKESLALSEDHFRSAISRSLELLGSEPLKKVDGPNGDGSKVQRWKFPELDRRAGADPTWVDTLDTLRPPRRKDQKIWEWRKEAPIRPVVFENLGTLDEDVVHLHLEHRVTQRLLNRFLTQGLVQDDLSRACVSQTRDAIPRVILLGRLSMYGTRAARLHDELVAVTARWTDPQIRKEALKPYAEDSEEKTLTLLEESLADPRLHEVQDQVKHKLANSAERDVKELLDYLEQRAERLATRAIEKLKARGEKEAQDLAEIIQAQRKRIADAVRKFETDRQLGLSFKDPMEVSQLEADHRHWEKRLKLSEEELNREPARIRESYLVKARRIEPVGLVYLWPISG